MERLAADSPPAPRRLVWSYQRTSTTRQARDDRSGMERQDLALAQWLKDHPEFELQDRLVDPGVSAGKGVHRTKGALGRFLAAVKAGQVPSGSLLIIESVSRFSREASSSALQSLLGGVFEPGLAIAFTGYDSGKVITSARWDDEPGLKYGLIAALDAARVEWEEKSARSKGAARKRERLQEEGEKVAAATPWWIQRDHETRRLVRDTSGSLLIDPTCKATILRAVELACGGMGSTLIAEALNNEQRPLPQTAGRRNQYCDRAGDRWGHGRVAYLLRHPALLGDLVRRDGRTIPGFYPPVLSIEKWHELRGSIEARDKLRGSLRGGGQKVNNLFMGITRCGNCGGPFSFHDSSERARIGHPGYMACRPANRRNSPGCSNSGYISYQAVEDHCLTRLAAPIWAELLGNSDGDARINELQALVDELEHALRPLETSHADAKRRLGQLFLDGASAPLMEASEEAVALLRDDIAAKRAEHDRLAGELQLERAKPTGEQAAAELKTNVFTLWRQLDAGLASPAERRAFNRWLRCHQPSIQFLVHPAQPGTNGRGVELVVGGVSAGTEPLAPVARRMARTAGAVEPYAKDFATSQGDSGVIAWQEKLGPEELENWPSH